MLEEPPEKTLFLLIAEDEEAIIQTIRSRCQVLHFGALPEKIIAASLVNRFQVETNLADKIAHQSQGNYNKAMHFLKHDEDELPFEEWFVHWVRSAFKAKGNATAIYDLIAWSDSIASIGRESQKQFLNYCIVMFRQALLHNYETKELVYVEPQTSGFTFDKFAPFVTGNNISEIFESLSDAIYMIERNGNAKIVLTDLSIKLTRLIHKK